MEAASNGMVNATYNYMADGTRTSKVVGGVTHTYYYSGNKLLRETYGSTVLDFFYDANGTPIAMKQNGAVYYYITNLQGDVVRLVNSAGNTAAWYKYDPYGNATTASGSHATINPLRYRGYYYDTETGLYYCQSRYYDPAIGRWINADAFASTGQGVVGHNMYAYCNNDPSNKADRSGGCSYFLFFKIDCFMASCLDSQCYNPDAPTIVVLYDGRDSGAMIPYFGQGDGGFEHQGQELIKRLSSYNNVESVPYITMLDFVDAWNNLDGNYDAIYILGHGQPGLFNARGGKLQCNDTMNSYSVLKKVDVKEMYLYICNGNTIPDVGASTAYSFAKLTGAEVHAVQKGKLNFTWYGCYPYMSLKHRGKWTTTSVN